MPLLISAQLSMMPPQLVFVVCFLGGIIFGFFVVSQLIRSLK